MLVDLISPFDSYRKIYDSGQDLVSGEGNIFSNIYEVGKEYVKSIPGTLVLGAAAKQFASSSLPYNIASKAGLSYGATQTVGKTISGASHMVGKAAGGYSKAVPKTVGLFKSPVGAKVAAIAAPVAVAAGTYLLLDNLEKSGKTKIGPSSTKEDARDWFNQTHVRQDMHNYVKRDKSGNVKLRRGKVTLSIAKDVTDYMKDIVKGTFELGSEAVQNIIKGGN